MDEVKPPKMICVCGNTDCRHHENSPAIEINFADSKIYWLCPKCKKMNGMTITPVGQPLPRTSLMGRRRP